MELQTLTAEIATSRSRLAAARKSKDHGRIKALEVEIAAAESRRERLLAHITTNLVGTPAGVSPSAAKDGSDLAPPVVADIAAPPAETDAEKPLELVDPIPGDAEPTAAAPKANKAAAAPAAGGITQGDIAQGGGTVWDKLTPDDIERATHEIDLRRTRTLGRHDEELNALDAERAQLETLEQAIANFTRKFRLTPAEDEIVKLDKERELRHQGG
jgi:hypothetical protein